MLACFSLVLGVRRCPASGACAANRVFRGFGVALAYGTELLAILVVERGPYDQRVFQAAGVLSGSSSASVLGEFFVFFDDGVAHVRQVRYLRQRVY